MLVTGGTFLRSYDGVTTSGSDTTHPATVSDFRFDKYEVTVGRFRRFKTAWDGGWRPAAGAGKHTHLNRGNGLKDTSRTSTYEIGWDAAWSSDPLKVSPTDSNLQCQGPPFSDDWTSVPGPIEDNPVSCVTWYEAYAFCIWDGGFLPSNAEWNYAASGGSEQRAYPWSRPPQSVTVDCSYANYMAGTNGVYDAGGGVVYLTGCYPSTSGAGSLRPVGSLSPRGDGRYGQADLAGNVAEYVIESAHGYVGGCHDCAYLGWIASASTVFEPVTRGGSFVDNAPWILSSSIPYGSYSEYRGLDGIRCARAP
jgi:formylglycine-generating enzyme required for sulfatase activity